MPKNGVLLLNMGGPNRPDEVKPFLYQLFSDPDIIKLPLSSVFQKPLAWFIVQQRGDEARENYDKIGGYSPQLKHTQEQAQALADRLASEFGEMLPVYIAMRYTQPNTAMALEQIVADGVEHLIVLPLYPHFSYTTTGSSLNELKRQMAEKDIQIPISIVRSYHDYPEYIASLASCVQETIDNNTWTCPKEEIRFLFSAHSLPLRHVKNTGDPYPEQIDGCIEALMKSHFPNNSWDLAFQSKVGKMPWLGPSTEGVLHYYSGKELDNILVIPLSFVSEHIETLFEIDQLYLPLAADLGIKTCFRSPVMNARPDFIEALTSLVVPRLQKTQVLLSQ